MSARAINPVMQFVDENGHPLNGGHLCTYDANSSAPKTTYSDKSLSVPNPVRIPLDNMGVPQNDVWLPDGSSYKFVVENSEGIAVWTRDYVSVPSSGGTPTPSESLFGHWLNENDWATLNYSTVVDVAQYMGRVEGDLGKEGVPYLGKGLYDFKIELAFNRYGVPDANEFAKYDLAICYGNETLREVSFSFRADTTSDYILTEWCCGVFKMEDEGEIKLNLKRVEGESGHKLKISHLFVHSIV